MRKPTATTLQTCQIAKARNSAGTLIHRLILAIASPSRCQKALSSGVQMDRTRARGGAGLEERSEMAMAAFRW